MKVVEILGRKKAGVTYTWNLGIFSEGNKYYLLKNAHLYENGQMIDEEDIVSSIEKNSPYAEETLQKWREERD